MVCDVIPCEDGHAQERALLSPILEQIRSKDCIIGDRNFCVLSFMSGMVLSPILPFRKHRSSRWSDFKCPITGSIELRRRLRFFSDQRKPSLLVPAILITALP